MYVDLQIVAFSYDKDPNTVPRISETPMWGSRESRGPNKVPSVSEAPI